jgi:hypothetical protein
MESAEDILARQIAIITPAQAKKAATIVLKSKTQTPKITPQIATPAITNTEHTQTELAQPPTTVKTTTAKWQPSRTAKTVQKPDSDRSCWLYLHNDTTRDIQSRRYKGDREQWKQALSAHLGTDFALTTGCTRVKAPTGE